MLKITLTKSTNRAQRKQAATVEALGLKKIRSFALHGDTLDVFGAASAYPVRIELFDDEVEAIRRIVPATGQSIGTVAGYQVFACREYIATP